MKEKFTIEPGDPRDAAVAALLKESEEFSRFLYPQESAHVFPAEYLTSPTVHFLVARDPDSNTLLGCGALVLQSNSYAELKRIFVSSEARRLGVASAILLALENKAKEEKVHTLLLETGVNQPEAVELYRQFGYHERGPFGEYRDDPLSIFMEKCLHE